MGQFNPSNARDFVPQGATPLQVRQSNPMALGPLPSGVNMRSPVPADNPVPIPKPQGKAAAASAAPQAAPPQIALAGRGPAARGTAAAFWGARGPATVQAQQSEVHQFEVLGEGPDGSQQVFVHEVDFPPGVRVLGVRYVEG